MFDKNLLKGKRILVTGGGSGLGKEMSRAFFNLWRRSNYLWQKR